MCAAVHLAIEFERQMPDERARPKQPQISSYCHRILCTRKYFCTVFCTLLILICNRLIPSRSRWTFVDGFDIARVCHLSSLPSQRRHGIGSARCNKCHCHWHWALDARHAFCPSINIMYGIGRALHAGIISLTYFVIISRLPSLDLDGTNEIFSLSHESLALYAHNSTVSNYEYVLLGSERHKKKDTMQCNGWDGVCATRK